MIYDESILSYAVQVMPEAMTRPRSVPFHDTQASVLLDILRALAAFLVLASHWRALLFVDYSQIASHGAKLSMALPYLLSGAGHQAVIVFFVLSGYLIGGSVWRKTGQKRWEWRDYMLHRLTRLWLVLIPALLLCALWDALALHARIAPALYSGLVNNHLGLDVHATHSWRLFFSNLFFLQGSLTKSFGSDVPLWSLANEFWYYLLFPCAVMALVRGSGWLSRLIHALVFVAIAVFLSHSILLLFPVWLLGAALAIFPMPSFKPALRPWIIVGYVPVFFFFAKFAHLNSTVSDYLLGIATAILMMALLSYHSEAKPVLWVRAGRRAAGFSYTLYLVHVPLLMLLTGVILGDRRWQPTPVHLVMAFGLMAVALIYAYLVALGTEYRTELVRDWVRARLSFLFPVGHSG